MAIPYVSGHPQKDYRDIKFLQLGPMAIRRRRSPCTEIYILSDDTKIRCIMMLPACTK